MNTQLQDKEEKPAAPWNFSGGVLIGLVVGVLVGLLQRDLIEGLGFGLLIGLALGAAFNRRDQMMQYSPRRALHVVIAVFLFLGTTLAWSTWKDEVTHPQLRWVLALAPGVGSLLLAHAVAQAIASLDELQRHIQTEAIAIGFGLTAVVVLSVGFLGEIGLEQPSWVYVPLIMIPGWGIGKAWTLWKYR